METTLRRWSYTMGWASWTNEKGESLMASTFISLPPVGDAVWPAAVSHSSKGPTLMGYTLSASKAKQIFLLSCYSLVVWVVVMREETSMPLSLRRPRPGSGGQFRTELWPEGLCGALWLCSAHSYGEKDCTRPSHSTFVLPRKTPVAKHLTELRISINRIQVWTFGKESNSLWRPDKGIVWCGKHRRP